MAMNMSLSQQIILDDSGVSQMMAEKAMHDQLFKEMLQDFVNSSTLTVSTRTKSKTAKAIIQIIMDFRLQTANQAGLKAPNTSIGRPRDFNTYLKQMTNSRLLLAKVNPKKEEGTEAVAEEDDYKWGWVGSPMCIARLALALLQSALRFQIDPTPFPFERLPPELRLQVYRETLSGATYDGVACTKTIIVACNRNNEFQFRFSNQGKGDSKEINASLLAASKLVNNEAIPVLFKSRTFDFTTNVKGVVPFLSSLSHEGRQNLCGIAMELHSKREPKYCCPGIYDTWSKASDNQGAWRKACVYIAKEVAVKQLYLTINVKVPGNFRSLLWVKALVKIKGLRYLKLVATQHSSNHTLVNRANYKNGLVSAADHCFNQRLVPFFEYLCEEMLE